MVSLRRCWLIFCSGIGELDDLVLLPLRLLARNNHSNIIFVEYNISLDADSPPLWEIDLKAFAFRVVLDKPSNTCTRVEFASIIVFDISGHSEFLQPCKVRFLPLSRFVWCLTI